MCLSASIFAQSSQVESILSSSVFDHASVGISVRDISNSNEVFGINSKKLLSPASSLKLITTFTALTILGEDFTFKTKLGYDGKIASDGTLLGDLVIIGGGDPSLAGPKSRSKMTLEELLNDIVATVKKAGITCIEGDLVVDNRIFDGQSIADEWNYNDIGNYFASGAWGLNINENLYWIDYQKNIKQGQKAVIQNIRPRIPQLTVQSEVKVASPKSGDNAYIYGGPQSSHKVVIGTIPQSTKVFSIKGSMPFPPLNAAEIVLNRLMKQKIKVGGTAVIDKRRKSFEELKVYQSWPLSKMVKQANDRSINLYCDAMLRMIGKQKRRDGSIEWGKKHIKEHLKSLGLEHNELVQKDGSGLARENLITAALMTDFLAQKQSEYGPNILKRLPQAGKEGTVKAMLGGATAGKFYLKSGSFSGVQSYSGYMKGKSGKSYTICVMANNYTCSYRTMRNKLEQLMVKLYQTH